MSTMQARTGGNNNNTEEELTSKTLQIQNKRFYLDVKQNSRGRFIKIAEVGLGGRKSRILMSMSTAACFRDNLETMVNTYTKLPPHNVETISGDGRIRSDMISRENRRYFLDLKENQRGRFLRITMMTPTNRSLIAVPAQGIVELRNSLQELIKEYGTDEDEASNVPEPKSLIIGGKRFYFDCVLSRNGLNLQLSEVRTLTRTAISVPSLFLEKFRILYSDLIDQANKAQKTKTGGENEINGEYELPESKSLRTDNKMFYFDIGSNHRGVFMRISEVRSNYRTAITIPERSWTKVRDIINEMTDLMTEGGDKSPLKKKTNSREEKAGGGTAAAGDVPSK